MLQLLCDDDADLFLGRLDGLGVYDADSFRGYRGMNLTAKNSGAIIAPNQGVGIVPCIGPSSTWSLAERLTPILAFHHQEGENRSLPP